MRKAEELLFWILHKIMMETIFFLDNVHQYNIAFSVVHVQVCIKSFAFVIISLYFFLPARVAANSKKFVLPVGLYERKITTVHSILTTMFKNIPRLFEPERPKIFKNIQPQPEN